MGIAWWPTGHERSSLGRDCASLGRAEAGGSLELYDRYWRLAEYYARRGKRKKAARLHDKAEAHYRRSGRPGPPFAAAMAMPRPPSPFFTWAVGNREPRGPDSAA